MLAAALSQRHGEAVQELAQSLHPEGDPRLQTVPLLAELLTAAKAAGALELEKDHVRLFLSPRGALCPPWEGAWVGESPRLFGPRHESVLAFARRLHVEPQDYERESADHIATELTLAGLFLSTGQKDLFREFWEEHLKSWLPSFGRCLEEHASTEFFRLVGKALQDLARASWVLTDPSAPPAQTSPHWH